MALGETAVINRQKVCWVSAFPKHPDYRFFPPQERRNSDREESAPSRLPTENAVREVMLAGVSEDIITVENGLSFLWS